MTTYATVIALYALGGLAGMLAMAIGIPLPWLIGPILVAAVLTPSFGLKAPPVALRMAGQLVVGAAMGLYLVPEAVARITGSVLPILLSAILTVVVAMGIGLLQARLLKSDQATAIYSNVPGGPVDMAVLAEHHGGDPARTALMQTIRIGLIVVLFPQLLLALGAPNIPEPATHLSPGEIVPLAAVLVVCVAAGFCARWIRLLNPFFMGPLLFVGTLTAFSVPLPDMPQAVIAAGQVLLGVSIGSMFRRDLFRAGPAFIATAIFSTVLLFGLCIVIAWGLAALFDQNLNTMILAGAPGGAAEMAVTAKAMELDVPLVVAFQMVRVIFIATMLPVIFSLFRALT